MTSNSDSESSKSSSNSLEIDDINKCEDSNMSKKKIEEAIKKLNKIQKF